MSETTKRNISVPPDLARVKRGAYKKAYASAIRDGASVERARMIGRAAAKLAAQLRTISWRRGQVERAQRAMRDWRDRHDRKPYTTGLRLPQHRLEG